MKTFIASDHHFSHFNFLSFTNDAGELCREFSSVEEMNQTMIDNHNRMIGVNDKVYFLGDLCFSLSAYDRIMQQLNGNKILIKGNHDKFKLHHYAKYFKDVRGSHRLDGMLLTHIPLHPSSLERAKLNIHGHTHHNDVKLDGALDLRYFNVCVEKHEYNPVDFNEIREFYHNNINEESQNVY